MSTFMKWSGVLAVPALLASCAQGEIEDATAQPAAVVAIIDLGDEHRIEFLRDPEGSLFYAEQGKLGTDSVGHMLARTSAPDIWRALVPGEPVPAGLASKADRGGLAEVPSPAASPVVLRRGQMSPLYEAEKEPLCKCYPMQRVGEAYPWIECWQDHTGPSGYRRDDTIGAETGFCNRSFHAVRLTVKHRTYFRWVTDFDRNIDNHKWERLGKVGDVGGLIDFDWDSRVTPLATPEPVYYDHVVTGVAFD